MPGKKFSKEYQPANRGRDKLRSEFRDRCAKAVNEIVIQAWINEVETHGKDWSKASELLAAYGLGKPMQPVEHSGPEGEPIELVWKVVDPKEET